MGLQNSIKAALFPHLRPKPSFRTASFNPNEDAFAGQGAAFDDTERDWRDANDFINLVEPAPDEDAAPVDRMQALKNAGGMMENAPPVVGVPKPIADLSGLGNVIAKTPVETARGEVARIAEAGPQKQSAIKQALWIALQGANKFLNPQDNQPVELLGNALHRRKMQNAQGKLAPLEALEARKQAAAKAALEIETKKSDKAYRDAMTGDVLRRPEKEKEAQENKLELEGLRQIGRIKATVEKDRLAGKNYKVETRADGRMVKKYPDREEPFLDGKGEQEYDKLEKPEPVEVEDGVNADGTKKYKTVYMKGGQYANLKASENYRESMLNLSKERLEETKRSNQVSERQRDEHFNASYGLAKERIGLARQNYELAVKKHEADKTGGGESESSKLARDRAKIALVNARSTIQQNLIMTDEEKQGLYNLLPNLDEQ